jgi:ferredoxin
VWVNPDVQPRTNPAPRRIQLTLEFGPLPRMNRRQRGPAELTPNHPPSRTQWTDDSMATYITEDCINCGACEPECPNEAISEGDEIYIIDPELCTECVGFYDHEACQAVCPVECCLPNPQIVESEELLIARAIKLHPDDAELKKRAEANDYPSRFRK